MSAVVLIDCFADPDLLKASELRIPLYLEDVSF